MAQGLYITGGKGFQLFFENGWGISVQFGPGNYCEHRDSNQTPSERLSDRWGSGTAEVAIFPPEGSTSNGFLRVQNNDVMDWVSANVVGQIIAILVSLPADADIETTSHRIEGLLSMSEFRKIAGGP